MRWKEDSQRRACTLRRSFRVLRAGQKGICPAFRYGDRLSDGRRAYLAAAWLFIHGVITIIAAVGSRNKGAGMIAVVTGVVLGVLELIMCVCSVIYPKLPAFNMGLLVGFYFIVSGIDMVFIGSDISRAVAASRSMTDSEI